MRRNGTRLAQFSASQKVSQTLLLRLSAGELRVSNVLIANWPTGLDIQFSIGQCQNEQAMFDWAMVMGGKDATLGHF